MAKVFVVPAYQTKNPLIETIIKYYAQSLLEKNQEEEEEEILIVFYNNVSIIDQIRAAGLDEKDCEFFFCACSPVHYLATFDGPFPGLNNYDDYFIGSQEDLNNKKISGFHIDVTRNSLGVRVHRCPITNLDNNNNKIDWCNPIESLYIPNSDLLKYFYKIKPIAAQSELNLFIQQMKEERLSLIRFKEPDFPLNHDNTIQLNNNFDQLLLDCVSLKKHLLQNNKSESVSVLETFIQTVTQAKSDWENTPKNWKTFTKTCQNALNLAQESPLQDFSEWNTLTRSFINLINWISSCLSDKPLFKTSEFARLSLFNQTVQNMTTETKTIEKIYFEDSGARP